MFYALKTVSFWGTGENASILWPKEYMSIHCTRHCCFVAFVLWLITCSWQASLHSDSVNRRSQFQANYLTMHNCLGSSDHGVEDHK